MYDLYPQSEKVSAHLLTVSSRGLQFLHKLYCYLNNEVTLNDFVICMSLFLQSSC